MLPVTPSLGIFLADAIQLSALRGRRMNASLLRSLECQEVYRGTLDRPIAGWIIY
jgi:hypothetical protein